jgi:hypothetical protein
MLNEKMEAMRHVGMLILFILAASFAGAQDVTVSVDQNPTAETDFDNYKTFSLANDAENDRVGHNKDYKQKDKAGMTGDVEKDKTRYDGDNKDKTDADMDQTNQNKDYRKKDTAGMTGDTEKDKTSYDANKGKSKTRWMDREHHIGKEIKSEMQSLGYTYTETNPDLLVIYRVLDEPGTITRIEGSRASGTPDPSLEQFEAEAGTLMVSIMDRETSNVVWQGFVSGLKDGDNHFTSDEGQIKAAAEILFDRFDHRGDDINISVR